MHWTFWIAAALALGLITVACRASGDESTGKPGDKQVGENALPGTYQSLEVMRMLTGTMSAADCEGLVVCRDEDSFQELWQRHTSRDLPAPAAPEVDFEHHFVVALFAGDRNSAGYGVEIQRISPSEDGVIVFAAESTPKEGMAQATVMTSPFEMVVVPQFDGTAELVWQGR